MGNVAAVAPVGGPDAPVVLMHEMVSLVNGPLAVSCSLSSNASSLPFRRSLHLLDSSGTAIVNDYRVCHVCSFTVGDPSRVKAAECPVASGIAPRRPYPRLTATAQALHARSPDGRRFQVPPVTREPPPCDRVTQPPRSALARSNSAPRVRKSPTERVDRPWQGPRRSRAWQTPRRRRVPPVPTH